MDQSVIEISIFVSYGVGGPITCFVGAIYFELTVFVQLLILQMGALFNVRFGCTTSENCCACGGFFFGDG